MKVAVQKKLEKMSAKELFRKLIEIKLGNPENLDEEYVRYLLKIKLRKLTKK